MQAALVAAKTDKTAMAKAAKKADALLREMVAVTLKSDLSRIQRTNLETCITVHMHQKETSGQSTPCQRHELSRKSSGVPSHHTAHAPGGDQQCAHSLSDT